jgi:sirohydrochlorin ferrochelatase
MKSLLIIGHGSPRPQANEDVQRIAEVIRGRGSYPIVIVGFLDCNQPDIPAAIEECVTAGATSVDAVPYFLHSGKHFLIDVPAMLDAAATLHPGLIVRMGDYVGREPQIADVLRDRARAALASDPGTLGPWDLGTPRPR